MKFLFVLFLILMIAALLAAGKRKAKKDDDLSFENRGPLFTPAERSFLGVLELALGSQYRVFGKIRLGDIVRPAKGLSNSKRTTALNKVNQKHVDFVICSATDMSTLCAVELDDQSHGRADRVTRDQFVDHALAGAKVPIAHFSAKKSYPVSEVRLMLQRAFQKGEVA